MKFVIISGGSCSGKTTIIKSVMKEKENYFHLDYDTVKWQFSKYVSGKYYEDIHDILITVLNIVCIQGHNVISSGAYHRVSREKMIAVAKTHGYEIVEINLEAEWNILSERFDERIVRALANPEKRIANTSKERFKELYTMYQNEKSSSAIVFRTDTQSIEEVSESVLKLL